MTFTYTARSRALLSVFLFAGFSALAPSHAGAVELLSLTVPRDRGIVWGDRVTAELRGCPDAQVQARLDGETLALTWEAAPYKDRWWAEVTGLTPGDHELVLEGDCWGLPFKRQSSRFTVSQAWPVLVADQVAWNFMDKESPRKLAWNWGPGVFLYGLHRLGTLSVHGDSYREYIAEFHNQAWAKDVPEITLADRVPPALSALALIRHEGDYSHFRTALPAARFVHDEPRNALGAIDHLGHSWMTKFFPPSIWVDSLMMYAVLGAQWGAMFNDPDLRDWAAAQPGIFAEVLRNPETGLLFHAWNVKKERTIPARKPTAWLRGNGWVATATAEILDTLPAGHAREAELRALFQSLMEGAARTQMANGLWDTLMSEPGQGYEETSGSALLAYAMVKGARRGWLPGEFAERGTRAFRAITARLERTHRGFSMTDVSWFTNPGSRAMYKMVPRCEDLPYGLGAYFLLAAEVAGAPAR